MVPITNDFAVRLNNGKLVTCEQYDEISRSADPEIRKYRDEFSLVHFDGYGKIVKEVPIGTDSSHMYKKRVDHHIYDEEVAALLADLDSTKTFTYPTLEEALKESREAYSQIPMYDYGARKKSNQQAIADFYGWDIVHRITREIEESYEHKLEDRRAGKISMALWQTMRDMRDGRIPTSRDAKPKKGIKDKKIPEHKPKKADKPLKSKKEKKKEIKVELREHQKNDDYFLRTDRGLVRNKSYRAIFKGPGTVYEWLWANIVREQWKDCEKYPIKKLYFDNGYLAYCSTYGQIGKACGMSKNTAHGYIKMFEKAGIVKTKPIVPDGETQGQTVFILGKWEMQNGKKVETYFRDSVFIIPQVVKN